MKRTIIIIMCIFIVSNLLRAWTVSKNYLENHMGLIIYSYIVPYTENEVSIGHGIYTDIYQYYSPPTTHVFRDYIESQGNLLVYPDSVIVDTNNEKALPVTQITMMGESNKSFRYPWDAFNHNIKVVIPKTVRLLNAAFAYAKPVVCAEIHNNLKKFGASAFLQSSLNTINVIEKPLQYNMGIVFPDSLKYVGNKAFSETPIRKVYCNEGLEEIASYAFAECVSLKDFSFPRRITKASDGVFEGCDSLENVDLNNVTQIGSYAFRDCKSLHYFDFKNVTTIGNSAFESCVSLSSLDLRNVSSIGNRGFYGCKNLSTIDLSKVDSIGKQCFEQCDTLQSVNLKKGIKIGSRAFYGCKNLNKLDLSRISYLGDSALAYCSGLDFTKLDLTGIDYVGRNAFLGNNIHELYIPKTTQFGYRPFGGSEISKVTFEEGRDSIPNDFLGDAKIVSDGIRISEGITYIGQSALEFANVTKKYTDPLLPTVILPSTLKTLDSYIFGITFYNLGPGGYRWVDGRKEFYNRYSVSFTDHVSRLIVLAETPPVFTDEFSLVDGFGEIYTGNVSHAESPLGVRTDLPIYVPNGTIEAYKSAEGWNKYTNYLEMSELTGINDITVDDNAKQGNNDDVYFDLQGRKVTNPQKGVYIHQGKKVMIK